MPHVSCFSFSICFFLISPPFIPFSLHMVFITIPSPSNPAPLPFLYHTFTHPVYSLICIPSSLFFCLYFFPFASLSLRLASVLPTPLLTLPLTSCSYLVPRCVYPTQLHPHFPWKLASAVLFPSFEALFSPDSSSKKVPAAQIIPSEIIRGQMNIKNRVHLFLTCP